MKQLWTVLRFEYINLIKGKYFIVITILMLISGVILPLLPALDVLMESVVGVGESETVAIADPSGRFTAEVTARYLPEHQIIYLEDAAQVQAAVSEGRCGIGALMDGYSYTLYVTSMKLSVYNIQDQFMKMARDEYRWDRLRAIGLTDIDIESVIDYVPESSIVTVSAPGDDSALAYMDNFKYAYFLLILLYMALIMYGQYILTSVVREKTTKTMELLIISCKAEKLINGKVLGVGLAGLTQMALVGIAFGVSMLAAGGLQTEGKLSIIGFMGLFFLLGFFAYAYTYAALASTVSRMEDAGSAAGFPMLLIITGFFVAIFGMMTPGAAWVTVFSYIPFYTPMVMFMRVCIGTAAAWEAWLAAAIQLAAILLTAKGAARIYRMGTLLYGKKLQLRDMIKHCRKTMI